MTSPLTLERVRRDIDVLSRAGLDVASMVQEVDASLRRAVPYDAACYATVDPATGLLTGTYKVGGLVGLDQRDHEWGLCEYGDPEPTSFLEMVRRNIASSGVHVTHDGDVLRSPRLRDFIVPYFSYSDELRVVGVAGERPWGGVAMFRDEGRTFTAEEIAFVGSIARSVGLAFRTGLLTRVADAAPPVASGPAVIVVDADGRYAMTSVGALERLALLGDGMAATSPEGVVASVVAGARRYASGAQDHLPRARVRLRSGQWFVLHGSPLAAVDGAVGQVVVTIEEARPPEIVPLVVEAFGLTGRERQVTQLALQGADTKEIAAALCVSTYTVQDHLKVIFEKAGVRSRRELTARVFFDHYAPRLGATPGADGWFGDAE